MYCSNCGQKVKEGAHFCTICGAKIEEDVYVGHKQITNMQTKQSQNKTTSKTKSQEEIEDDKRNLKEALIVIGIVLVVSLILVMIPFIDSFIKAKITVPNYVKHNMRIELSTPKYPFICTEDNTLYMTYEDNKKGIEKENGKKLISCKYDYISYNSNDLIVCTRLKDWTTHVYNMDGDRMIELSGLVDVSENVTGVLGVYTDIEKLNENRRAVGDSEVVNDYYAGEKSYIDLSGNTMFENVQSVQAFANQYVVTIQPESTDDYDGKCFLANESGMRLSGNYSSLVHPWENLDGSYNYQFRTNNGGFVFLNQKGYEVNYNNNWHYYAGMAEQNLIVGEQNEDGKIYYGVVNKAGEEIIPIKYKKIEVINGIFVCKDANSDNQIHVICPNGKVIGDGVFSDVKTYRTPNNEYILVGTDSEATFVYLIRDGKFGLVREYNRSVDVEIIEKDGKVRYLFILGNNGKRRGLDIYDEEFYRIYKKDDVNVTFAQRMLGSEQQNSSLIYISSSTEDNRAWIMNVFDLENMLVTQGDAFVNILINGVIINNRNGNNEAYKYIQSGDKTKWLQVADTKYNLGCSSSQGNIEYFTIEGQDVHIVK